MSSTVSTTLEQPSEAIASPGDTAPEPHEIIIRPRKGWIAIDWAELWHYRELLYFLAWRDVNVHYEQTVLRMARAVLPPVFSMIVPTLIFGKLVRIPSDGLAYARHE